MTRKRKMPLSGLTLSDESYLKSYWRPFAAWTYLGICAFDFILAPISYALLQAYLHYPEIKIWDPLTLRGAGMLHISFGAIIGITAWKRSEEKIDVADDLLKVAERQKEDEETAK